eukprot:PhM_4_TR16348/c0_g1_i1/m.24859
MVEYGNHRLFVGGLPEWVSESDVAEAFSVNGIDVHDIEIALTGFDDGSCRGFAHVSCSDALTASKACRTMNKRATVKGNLIRVEVASTHWTLLPKEPIPRPVVHRRTPLSMIPKSRQEIRYVDPNGPQKRGRDDYRSHQDPRPQKEAWDEDDTPISAEEQRKQIQQQNYRNNYNNNNNNTYSERPSYNKRTTDAGQAASVVPTPKPVEAAPPPPPPPPPKPSVSPGLQKLNLLKQQLQMLKGGGGSST